LAGKNSLYYLALVKVKKCKNNKQEIKKSGQCPELNPGYPAAKTRRPPRLIPGYG